MYKSAILGCGGRARGHARAYEHVVGGKLAAICDMDTARLDAFGDHFGISARYNDVHEMLDVEKPDLLHVVTQPDLRVPLLTIAVDHQTPAVIVEKPIALQGEDYRQLRDLDARSDTKICLNHQLHFHRKSLELQQRVQDGAIGELRFLDASARLNLSGQGTHVLELVAAFNPGAQPTSVFGQVSGAGGLHGGHCAPEECVATISYDNGVQAQLVCGTNARPISDEPANHQHKRIAAYGTAGMAQWTMSWWESTRSDGSVERGEHEYGAEDVLGQAGLTDAVFDWLTDGGKPHPTNLDASLTQFNIILGIYMSALQHRPIELPVEPDADLIEQLRGAL
jgi:predicted dehydrogenase